MMGGAARGLAVFAVGAAVATAIAACEDAAVVPCREGVGRIVGGRSWCALSAEQIAAVDGTVMCPLETPSPLRIGGAAVCAESPVTIDEVPGEVLDLLRTECATTLPTDDCLLASHLEGDALEDVCGMSIELVRGEARVDPGGSCGDALRGGEGARAVVIAGDVSLVEHGAITIDLDVLVADPATGGERDPTGALYVQQDGEHALYLEDGHLAAVIGTRCGGSPPTFHRALRDPEPFPADGRWHHVALYVDGRQRILELYVDRVFAASSELSSEPYCGPIATPSTGTGARLGGGSIDGAGFPGALPGWIDELVVRRGAHTPVARVPSGRCVEDAECAAAGDQVRDRGDGGCTARASCSTVFACPEEAIGGPCP